MPGPSPVPCTFFFGFFFLVRLSLCCFSVAIAGLGDFSIEDYTGRGASPFFPPLDRALIQAMACE